MSLTQIQRDAMARAQRGDWLLADAIELQHRIRNDNDVCGGYREAGRLRYIVEGDNGQEDCHECGGAGNVDCDTCRCSGLICCETCEGEGDTTPEGASKPIQCEDCEGTGEVECPDCDEGKSDCEDCGGSGESQNELLAHTDRITNLDGDVIWSDGPDADDEPYLGEYVDKVWADQIVQGYHEEVDKAVREECERQKAQAAANAAEAAANLPPSNQKTLIPEHA